MNYKNEAKELSKMILKYSIERDKQKAHEDLIGIITPKARGILKKIESERHIQNKTVAKMLGEAIIRASPNSTAANECREILNEMESEK